MRLQKYMAHCGVASRRKCEQLIASGRVRINGKVATEMGVKINPQHDRVQVDQEYIQLHNHKIYIMLNKPRGYITTVRDQFGRPTVLDLIGRQNSRIYPVGRLDWDSEGLLLLTNDGPLAHRLTHPRYKIQKTYYVLVNGQPSDGQINKLRRGVTIGNHQTSPAKIKDLGSIGNQRAYRMTISEGKNRQIRRMFESIGHTVILLRREKFGNLVLGNLKPGQWRDLTAEEVQHFAKTKWGD
jgi:23S rRNA pseudouridine2605 synthase